MSFFERARLFTGASTSSPLQPSQPTGDRPVRTGIVRVNGRDLEDDQGSLNALGCTLFPAPWCEKNDVPRLEGAFATLAAGPYQFYRSGTGFQPDSWEDRMSDPGDVDNVIKMATRGAKFGLRAHHVIFMDGSEAPGAGSVSERRAIIEQWAAKLPGHEHKFLALEIVNENGPGHKMPIAEMRELGAWLQSKTSVPIILTSTGSNEEWVNVYRDCGLKLATQHFGRDDSGDGGRWEWLSKPSEFPVEHVGNGPTACLSGEPKGPGSSGRSEWNVNRMVMSYVSTFVQGCGGYVFHPGPGIRLGGAHDRSRTIDGRLIPEALDQLPEFVDATKGFSAAQAYLPRGVANWRRWKGHRAQDSGLISFITYRHTYDNGAPDNGVFDQTAEPRRLFKAFLSQSPDGRSWLAAVMRLAHPMPVEVKQAMKVEAFDAVTGKVFQSETLSTGQHFQLTPRSPSGADWDSDGFLLRGTL